MNNNIGILVRFYYQNNDMNQPEKFKIIIKSIEYNGNIIFDLGFPLSGNNVVEDWTYIPLHMLDISETDLKKLSKDEDDKIMNKISDYTKTEFLDKQDMKKIRSNDNNVSNIDCSRLISSCTHNCSSCSACVGCSRSFLK